MKKILLITCVLVFLLSSCNQEFTFRGHKYGDSKEDVSSTEDGIANEEYNELEDRDFLRYEDIEIAGYSGQLQYIFDDDELEQIFYFIIGYEESVELDEVYGKLIKEYKKYGAMVEDEQIENGPHKALLKNGDAGLVLMVDLHSYFMLAHCDYEKCELFFQTLSFSSLYN